MHSAINRLQATFGYFTSCAFTLGCIIALLSVIPWPAPEGTPSAKIVPRDIQVVKGRPHYYSRKREEYAQIKFDLDADLSSLFTWNTKQLFVYITANYPSSAGAGSQELSESVIWDMIIPATSNPYSWQNLKTHYFPDKKASKKTKSRKSSTSDKSSTTALSKPGVLKLKNQKSKYQITDPTGVMSERSNITLQISWNVQPWVGALVWDKGYLGSRTAPWKAGKVGRSQPFDLPALKGSKPEVVKDPDGPKTPKAAEATPVV